MVPVPANPKIYHIVHIDRLASIIRCNGLLSDAALLAQSLAGTTIGMDKIKLRRLNELKLSSHPDLSVGQCVPFYFCPRSIMLYLISQANHPELTYRGGQTPILHLQADLQASVAWASQLGRRWAFTKSNAGSYYFDDYCDLTHLHQLHWGAIQATLWNNCKELKQAEFLMEKSFPWELIEAIGVLDLNHYRQVISILDTAQPAHRPAVKIKTDWYY